MEKSRSEQETQHLVDQQTNRNLHQFMQEAVARGMAIPCHTVMPIRSEEFRSR
jgi:hypothetical protein